jgi:hypothetical protein
MHPLMWLVKVLINDRGGEIVQMYAPNEIIFWSCGTTTLNRVVSMRLAILVNVSSFVLIPAGAYF